MKTFVASFLLFSLADSIPAKKSHKHLPSHVHGEVKLDISIDKTDLLVEMESPAESLLGFEHKARTSKDKKLVAKTKADWTDNLLKYLALPDCKILKSHWRQKFTGKHHSAVLADGHIQCPYPLHGRKLKISLKKYYPAIDEIHLRLIGKDGLSKQKEFSTPTFTIFLSK